MTERYLEDFAVGQTIGSKQLGIDKERAKAFAAEFDPQPFHLDDHVARRTIFGGLTVSGWHTAAVTMRLLVESDLRSWQPTPFSPGNRILVYDTSQGRDHVENMTQKLGWQATPSARRSTLLT